MAAIMNQPLSAKHHSLLNVDCPWPILLAQAMATNPHTALPSVNRVGMTAIFFTSASSEELSESFSARCYCNNLPDLIGK